jgi:hypothetical protein
VPGEHQRAGDPGRGEAGGKPGEERITLTAEDPNAESDPAQDQRQRIDCGVEEAEIELTLGDRLRRHPEVPKDPGADADAGERAAGHDQPGAELRPRSVGRGPRPATVSCEQAVRVHDALPGLDVARLREDLQHDRSDDPFPANVLEAMQGLLERRQQPQQKVGEDGVAQRLQRSFLKLRQPAAERPAPAVPRAVSPG